MNIKEWAEINNFTPEQFKKEMVKTMTEVGVMDDLTQFERDTLEHFTRNLFDNQEPLGAEFQSVLDDNLDDLYVTDTDEVE